MKNLFILIALLTNFVTSSAEVNTIKNLLGCKALDYPGSVSFDLKDSRIKGVRFYNITKGKNIELTYFQLKTSYSYFDVESVFGKTIESGKNLDFYFKEDLRKKLNHKNNKKRWNPTKFSFVLNNYSAAVCVSVLK